MRRLTAAALFLLLTMASSPSAISQLRNLSDYTQDRINPDKTYFELHDAGAAEFAWASEWTYRTADNYETKYAMFVWQFKDGTKAYSKQGEGIDAMGKKSGFLVVDKASFLEDIHRNKIQPLTRDNYPIKVELWIGDIDNSKGFSPEYRGDVLCYDAPGIQTNTLYHFADCPPE